MAVSEKDCKSEDWCVSRVEYLGGIGEDVVLSATQMSLVDEYAVVPYGGRLGVEGVRV